MGDDQTIQETRYGHGLRIRREVLGVAHVDRLLAAATEFSRAVRDVTVEYCWGYAWSR